jgi:hypothetical protein
MTISDCGPEPRSHSPAPWVRSESFIPSFMGVGVKGTGDRGQGSGVGGQ